MGGQDLSRISQKVIAADDIRQALLYVAVAQTIRTIQSCKSGQDLQEKYGAKLVPGDDFPPDWSQILSTSDAKRQEAAERRNGSYPMRVRYDHESKLLGIQFGESTKKPSYLPLSGLAAESGALHANLCKLLPQKYYMHMEMGIKPKSFAEASRSEHTPLMAGANNDSRANNTPTNPLQERLVPGPYDLGKLWRLYLLFSERIQQHPETALEILRDQLGYKELMDQQLRIDLAYAFGNLYKDGKIVFDVPTILLMANLSTSGKKGALLPFLPEVSPINGFRYDSIEEQFGEFPKLLSNDVVVVVRKMHLPPADKDRNQFLSLQGAATETALDSDKSPAEEDEIQPAENVEEDEIQPAPSAHEQCKTMENNPPQSKKALQPLQSDYHALWDNLPVSEGAPRAKVPNAVGSLVQIESSSAVVVARFLPMLLEFASESPRRSPGEIMKTRFRQLLRLVGQVCVERTFQKFVNQRITLCMQQADAVARITLFNQLRGLLLRQRSKFPVNIELRDYDDAQEYLIQYIDSVSNITGSNSWLHSVQADGLLRKLNSAPSNEQREKALLNFINCGCKYGHAQFFYTESQLQLAFTSTTAKDINIQHDTALIRRAVEEQQQRARSEGSDLALEFEDEETLLRVGLETSQDMTLRRCMRSYITLTAEAGQRGSDVKQLDAAKLDLLYLHHPEKVNYKMATWQRGIPTGEEPLIDNMTQTLTLRESMQQDRKKAEKASRRKGNSALEKLKAAQDVQIYDYFLDLLSRYFDDVRTIDGVAHSRSPETSGQFVYSLQECVARLAVLPHYYANRVVEDFDAAIEAALTGNVDGILGYLVNDADNAMLSHYKDMLAELLQEAGSSSVLTNLVRKILRDQFMSRIESFGPQRPQTAIADNIPSPRLLRQCDEDVVFCARGYLQSVLEYDAALVHRGPASNGASSSVLDNGIIISIQCLIAYLEDLDLAQRRFETMCNNLKNFKVNIRGTAEERLIFQERDIRALVRYGLDLNQKISCSDEAGQSESKILGLMLYISACRLGNMHYQKQVLAAMPELVSWVGTHDVRSSGSLLVQSEHPPADVTLQAFSMLHRLCASTTNPRLRGDIRNAVSDVVADLEKLLSAFFNMVYSYGAEAKKKNEYYIYSISSPVEITADSMSQMVKKLAKVVGMNPYLQLSEVIGELKNLREGFNGPLLKRWFCSAEPYYLLGQLINRLEGLNSQMQQYRSTETGRHWFSDIQNLAHRAVTSFQGASNPRWLRNMRVGSSNDRLPLTTHDVSGALNGGTMETQVDERARTTRNGYSEIGGASTSSASSSSSSKKTRNSRNSHALYQGQPNTNGENEMIEMSNMSENLLERIS